MKRHIAMIGAAVLGFLNAVNAQNNVNLLIGSPANSTPPYYGLWTDSGISVTNGEWINVNAAGYWTWDGAPPDYFSPDGYFDGVSDLFLGNGIHAGMIAYVGSDPFQGNWGNSSFFPQDTGYWELGTSGQFMSTTNGELWLGFNDDAIGEATGDNNGQSTASIFTGFTSAPSIGGPIPSITSVSSNLFSFSISNGVPNTDAAIYDSADLTHWTLIGAVGLDGSGSYSNYVNTTGVPYRFYKVCNGQFISRTIGFVRLIIPGSTTNSTSFKLIANQFDGPKGNTLNDLFDPMPDGTFLPTGTEIGKWNGTSYSYYTWNGSGWGANGNVTLNPGEGEYILNPTNTAFTVTFLGLVREGNSSLTIPSGQFSLVSSILPKAGYLQHTLGYIPTLFGRLGDRVDIWDGNDWEYYSCIASGWNPSEPIIKVGEGFFIQPYATNVWTETYSSRHF